MLSPTIHASGRKSAMVNKIHLQHYSDMHVAKVTKPPALWRFGLTNTDGSMLWAMSSQNQLESHLKKLSFLYPTILPPGGFNESRSKWRRGIEDAFRIGIDWRWPSTILCRESLIMINMSPPLTLDWSGSEQLRRAGCMTLMTYFQR